MQIILSYTSAFNLLLHLLGLSSRKAPQATTVESALLDLRQRLDLGRRYFRVFRFLECFHGAQKLSASLSGSGKQKPAWVQADVWLDLFGRTFCGMYLLLEMSTVVDYMQIEGLGVWGPERRDKVNVEAQRFWFLTLACAIASGILQIVALLLAYPPSSAPAAAGGAEPVREKTSGSAAADDEKKMSENATQSNVEEANVRRRKFYRLGKTLVSNAIDIVIPGSIVGWLDVDPGTIGVAMFVTTILTTMDVWNRCGKEVLAKQ